MPSFAAKGVHIFYRVEGHGDVVVLIHGLGSDHTAWEGPVVEGMLRNRTVVRMDLRGHGRSGRGREKHSIDLYARDVGMLLRGIGVEHARVLGILMGGAVAVSLAHQFLEHILAIGLIDTWAHCDEPARACFREWEVASRSSRKLLQELVLIRTATPQYVTANPSLIARFRRCWPTNHGSAFRAACRACTEHDARPYLAGIHVPALVMVGDRDLLVPPSHSRQLVRQLRHARLHVVRGAGHVPWLDAPEVTVRALQQFVRRA